MYPPSGVYSDTYDKDMVIMRTRLQWVLLLAFLVFVVTIPHWLAEEWTRFILVIFIYIIAVQGLSILTGYAGQVNIGQSAFMMVGAFTSGLLTSLAGWNFWLAFPVAGIAAAMVGLVFGLPTARVKELYLALTTLAAQFVILWVGFYQMPKRMGATGFSAPAPAIGGFVFDTYVEYYYFALFFCILFVFIAKSIVRSGLGRAFVAIRDNDIAAQAIGINIFYYKLVAFAICTFFAGIAGALYTHYLLWVHAEQFTLLDSVWFIGMVIVGGMGSTIGAIFGVIFLQVLRQMMLIFGAMLEGTGILIMGGGSGILQIAFGLAILLFLIFEPRGLAHRWNIFKASYRLWPFAQQ
jgi:branched-chain amino acid transport system permease protein